MPETTPRDRFAIDHAAARTWLAARDGVAHFAPADETDAGESIQLVHDAQAAHIITDALSPGGGSPALLLDFRPDGDGDGYRWLLYHDDGDLICATRLNGMAHLGAGLGAAGPDAAMAVLSEAVAEGNGLATQITHLAARIPDHKASALSKHDACQPCGQPVVTITWEERLTYEVTVHRSEIEDAYHSWSEPMPGQLADLDGSSTHGAMESFLADLAEGNLLAVEDRQVISVAETRCTDWQPVPSPPPPGVASLAGQLRALHARHGDLPGAEVVPVVTEFLAAHGFDLEP